MSPEITTSFIPKSGSSHGLSKFTTRRKGANLLLLSSIFVVLVVGAIFGGAFGYRYYLLDILNRDCHPDEIETKSCGLLVILDREKSAMDMERTIEYKRVDDILKIANQILGQHNTLVPMFKFLEDSTIHNVRLTNLSFEFPDNLNLKASTISYEDIAAYQQVLSQRNEVKSLTISDIGRTVDGEITFSASLKLDSQLLSYIKNLN
ncbi:MAG TPA: hypothetical protein ENN31_00250 [Candidatus Vogelbacteria bacterium]|nr:hypothetical protein [Candidatus Vogelbacteria bacterium]